MPKIDLRGLLDHPSATAAWFDELGFSDRDAAIDNLRRIAALGLTDDLFLCLTQQLAEHLPGSADADRALNNLERFWSAQRNPLALAALFERDRESLPSLLTIFAASQCLSDLLARDPEGYDLLRMTDGQPVPRESLIEELCAEVHSLRDDLAAVALTLRRFKQRETLRIAYGDLVRGQRVEVVTEQISYLADAIVEAAVRAAWLKAARTPAQTLGKVAPSGDLVRQASNSPRFVVLALGKLGGAELNYSSDIDLIFLYESPRSDTNGRQPPTAELCDRVAREVIKLLADATELGVAYRVDMRLRPYGASGPLASSVEAALAYYDTAGRTWERQAFVKARPIAGHRDLGEEFLSRLEPWIYRRYLSRADITGIKALKRRIEQRVLVDGHDERNVKTGRGGIRDIEFVIQFLQLLNGGDLPNLRTGNTLAAIAQLESAGCLTLQERTLLEENYRFLRRIEHRLQIMFDLQTHLLPESDEELGRLALRLGIAGSSASAARDALVDEYRQRAQLNRRVIDHLLHDAFGDEGETAPESDLVLDPEPGPERSAAVLAPYGFFDLPQAYANLMDLALEKIRFLSTRRCRHFLAAIAPKLLAAIAATPDPDFTLNNLCRVSDSLGGKGVLWELFSFHPPSLRMYVELCSSSEYLSSMLTANPGMIDELMDGLLLDKLPTSSALAATLDELCAGAEDLEPILHSFKNSQQLRVGVRDILGKERIEAINGALSEIAAVILTKVAATQYEQLVVKLGEPTLPRENAPAAICRWAILALGKFGGRELNYYSDLDLIFLYEDEGTTQPLRKLRRDSATITSNQHFFSELGQRIIKVVNRLGPLGRLYQIDPRLRPTGKSGSLATSRAEFRRYFADGQGQLWERLSLCKGRVIHDSGGFADEVMEVVTNAAYGPAWRDEDAAEVRDMRGKMEASASAANLKRGLGGLADVEFVAQMLQLKFGHDDPSVRAPATLDGLARLQSAGYLPNDDGPFFIESYRFLRTLQARMRLISSTARDTLPDDPRELAKLARWLHEPDGAALLARCQHYTSENRRRFALLVEESAESTANE